MNTDGSASAAEGADQAQYEICPGGSLAGGVEGGAAGGPTASSGGLPNTAVPARSDFAGAVAIVGLGAAVAAHAVVRRRAANRLEIAPRDR